MGLFSRIFHKEKNEDLQKGLEKTKNSFFEKLGKAIVGKSTIDDEVLDHLEQILISSDVGLETSVEIIKRIEQRVAEEKYLNTRELSFILRDEIIRLLEENIQVLPQEWDTSVSRPVVWLIVGVNGVGKTTTIGKLAYQLTSKNYKVMVAAGDTFRAAAEDQLKIWSERVGCSFFTKGMGADPSAVAYEAVKSAIAQGQDFLIIDTAGRLHTKVNLMAELEKINRSIAKALPGAPHEVLLVLDATTGQNAIEQCRKFTNSVPVTGLILTKLDGSAKGGVAIGISQQFRIPIKFIGVGESLDKLQVFDARSFVYSLFEKSQADI